MTERVEARDANALLKHLREQMGEAYKGFETSFTTMQPAEQLELLVLWNMVNSSNINAIHSRFHTFVAALTAEQIELEPETKQ
jgi:hypothetical protein